MAMTFFPSSVLAISLIAAESAFLKSAVMIFDFSETMIPSLAMAQLASGQIDVMPEYADARMDDAAKWTTTFGAKESIWDDTNVIGVTPAIANDGIHSNCIF